MGASNFTPGVDLAFKIIIGTDVFFLVGITAVMIYFILKYRRSRHPKAVQMKDNNILEITWTVIPVMIVLVMFYYGYAAFAPMRNVPADAMPVTVIGKMWTWTFEYEGQKQSNELVVPINKPVKLNLKSLDVIHGLYIPAFRVKEDVVPGKNNYCWFIPELAGEYNILCSAYCGLQHSYMEAKVRVVSEAEFKTWLAGLQSSANEPAGLTIIKNNACTGCHSLDGSKLVSTSFKGLYGKTETVITDGNERQVLVDDAYIMTSIYDPGKDVVKGYPKGVMQPYKGKISEDDVKKIIEYLKTLK
jgi:cytochrome c oxidase subunit II